MSDTRAQGESVATAIHPRDASDWQRLRRTRNRWRFTRRRGLSTAWLLLFGPVFLVLLGLVVEIGNIYVAQSQLENAMEAAALAAVKEWGGSAPSNDWTLIPRQVGAAYGNVNEVAGQRLGDFSPMGLNYQPGGTSNNNASCGGDLVFGAVSFEEPFEFQANLEPSCTITTSGTATVTFSIDTGGSAGCVNAGDKPSDTTTFRCAGAWTFDFFSATGAAAGISIVGVSINLQAAGTDNGEFDFDTTGGAPTTELYGVGAREGYGPFFNSADSSAAISSGDVSFYQNAAGTIAVPATGQSSVLTTRIAPGVFTVGRTLVIGVDTDMVGNDVPVGNPAQDTRDDGGDMKTAGNDFAITFYFNSFDVENALTIFASDAEVQGAANKTFLNRGRAKNVTFEIPGQGSYAVRAQKTIAIPSLCGGVLGIASSFNIYAKATAMWRCDVEDVSLIRLSSFQCTD